jgi:integrase
VRLSPGMARDLEERWLFVEDAETLVFPSDAGTVINSSNLMRRTLKPAGRRAGVPWAGFHTFRHTCATMLFRAGENAVAVQKQMGHHSPAFTLATYVHFLDDDLPSVDFLDGVTAGGNEEATRPTETLFRAGGDDEGECTPFAAENLGTLRPVGG